MPSTESDTQSLSHCRVTAAAVRPCKAASLRAHFTFIGLRVGRYACLFRQAGAVGPARGIRRGDQVGGLPTGLAGCWLWQQQGAGQQCRRRCRQRRGKDAALTGMTAEHAISRPGGRAGDVEARVGCGSDGGVTGFAGGRCAWRSSARNWRGGRLGSGLKDEQLLPSPSGRGRCAEQAAEGSCPLYPRTLAHICYGFNPSQARTKT